MFVEARSPLPDYSDYICPDLQPYWQIKKHPQREKYYLSAVEGAVQHPLLKQEAEILQHFNGKLSVAEIQQNVIFPEGTVAECLDKLIQLEILTFTQEEIPDPPPPQPAPDAKPTGPQLKPSVHWIEHPGGYWILRNPEDVTFMQVDGLSKTIIDQLATVPMPQLIQRYGITPDQMQLLLRQLATTAMLEGTTPPKPPKRKFTPLQLLYFKVPLFNPDPYLQTPAQWLSWIWTAPFFYLWCGFITWTGVLALDARPELVHFGKVLWENNSRMSLLVPFILLALFVVTIHELGHALTLKHYKGIVPDMGLLFMCLMPAAYTNTTDGYLLVKRIQRVLVVAVGVMVQVTIGAIAFWLWTLADSNHWLHPTSFLLLCAALFTVAINLNPLAKFDGYYLAVALTGINNLRSRSFGFYLNLLTLKPIQETAHDCFIFALFAPLSLCYITLVFGSLFLFLLNWTVVNLLVTATLLLLFWAFYYFTE